MGTMTCLCKIMRLLLVIGWLLYNVKLLEATTADTHGHDDLFVKILPLLLVIGWLLYNVKLLEATTAGTHGHNDLFVYSSAVVIVHWLFVV